MAHQDVYPPWKIVRRLGAGSLTEAFLVEGPSGAAVLKRLLPFFLSNEALCTAFVLKAEESKALSHPNIVKVLQTGAHGRDRYAVMENVEGRALSRAAARMTEKGWAALPHDCVSAVGVAAAEAMHFAHGQGVLHLDVTLHNLYLGPDGALKLADFGLAHTRRSTTTEQGSRELLPPELRLEDPASASPAADVWALGLCLYRLAGGVVPVNAEQNA
ncbi:MAG: protein kinase domain-containing protein, partial [Myxococcaceae bacterium]